MKMCIYSLKKRIGKEVGKGRFKAVQMYARQQTGDETETTNS